MPSVNLDRALRLSTRIRLSPNPLRVPHALAVVRAWIDQPPSVILEPTPWRLDAVAGLLSDVGVGANLANDAHLADLALEHDATVVTYDSDFGRLSGVRWRRPDDRGATETGSALPRS